MGEGICWGVFYNDNSSSDLILSSGATCFGYDLEFTDCHMAWREINEEGLIHKHAGTVRYQAHL